MKKFLVTVGTFFLTASAFATPGPGDLVASVEQRVRDGIAACGLQTVSGQDPRLSYQIRSRNIDYVIVKTTANKLNPGVLVDSNIYDQTTRLVYSKINGGLLMSVARDLDLNDVAVDKSDLGRVAFSQTYRDGPNGGLQTRYYVVRAGSREQTQVGAEEFKAYVEANVADEFAALVCREAGKVPSAR